MSFLTERDQIPLRGGYRRLGFHPGYTPMVNEAISAMQPRDSSLQMIVRYIWWNFPVGYQAHLVNRYTIAAIRRGLANNTIVNTTRAHGAVGRFRLVAMPDPNRVNGAAANKPAAKKPAAKKAATGAPKKTVSAAKRSPTKQGSAKKATVKKATAKKAVPKKVAKPAAKKAVPKKVVSAAKRSPTKQGSAKKATVKKAPAMKVAPKKVAKPAAKKAVPKKANLAV